LDSDDWLNIDEYVCYILVLGYTDDFVDLSWLNILLGLFYSCQQVFTYSKYYDLPEELTDYTWHLPNNYNVHVTIITGKILYTVTTLSCYTCYVSCYAGILFTNIIYYIILVS